MVSVTKTRVVALSETHSADGKPLMGTDGQPLERLVFRSMRAGDLKVFDDAKGENASMVALIARLTNQTPRTIEALDMTDYAQALMVVMDFLKPFMAMQKAMKALKDPEDVPSSSESK